MIPVWNSVDPLADDYPGWSPYNYALGNPMRLVDPDGRGPTKAAVKAARKVLSKRLIRNARKTGVRRAWAQELKLLRETGNTFTEFTAKEKDELLRTGKVSGYEGHHINSVQSSAKTSDLEMMMNPDNIKFVKGRKAHIDEHGGDWHNETSGPLLDRLSKLSGPALLVFFIAFDNKMKELAADSPIISNPDAWHSYINPYNYLVENIALLEAFTAAYAEQERYEAEQRAAQGGGCGGNEGESATACTGGFTPDGN